ncbi:MAG: type VII toxin-antitoxin system HepT family RNase toxin [Acidimicrobiales bacterium]
MVDPTRLRRLLQHATDELSFLRAERDARVDVRHDDHRLRAVKYAWIVAIEACIDAAQHVCATAGWGPPESNADAMRVLGHHGALDAAIADGMARAVGFRNILVHGYIDVDDDRVVGFLDQIETVDRFVASISNLLTEPT